MVYSESWDTFISGVEALYRKNPNKTRYVLKYRHNDAIVQLKVTDDSTCLQFETDAKNHQKYVEKINNLFLELMCAPEVAAADQMQDE